MCIVAFAFGVSADYPLVFAANRDELHTRPTAVAAWWNGEGILGGRDLVAGGSWLGVTRAGQLAAVTNLPQSSLSDVPRSRGTLVSDFLRRDLDAGEFVGALGARAEDYGPFNFLGYDGRDFHYVATGAPAQRLAPGSYALSNALLGTDWPKVATARRGLEAALQRPDPAAALQTLLRSTTDTLGDDRLRRRSALFIEDPEHGTRATTVVLISADGELRFTERSFAVDGRQTAEVDYAFALER